MAENAAPPAAFSFFLAFFALPGYNESDRNRSTVFSEIRFERGYVIMMDAVKRAIQNVTEGTGR